MRDSTNSLYRHPRIIDILLNVIDNFGDIGFCSELISAWRREVDTDSIFCIWTNNTSAVSSFVDKNRHILGRIEIKHIDDFGRERLSKTTLALFHTDIPDVGCFSNDSLVLRIDYLSFDATWIIHHLDEHISSTPYRHIIEIIPATLPHSGGLLHPYDAGISRESLASRYDLDPDKNWIILFAYPSTLDTLLHFDNIDSQSQILVFGSNQDYVQSNIINMPWVDIATWHALIDASSWTLVRGEVSAIASLMRDKLSFWDMYKMIGGFNSRQSDDYLGIIEANSVYRDIHHRLNGQESGGVYWSELEEYIATYGTPKLNNKERINNLITEIKKCIDSHEFSI